MVNTVVPTGEYVRDGLYLQVTPPAPDLAPFVSAIYRTQIDSGAIAEDWLPPEEANLRTGIAEVYTAAIGSDPAVRAPDAVVSGPTDRATYLRIGGGRFWGIGLTPSGWSRIIALRADTMANRFVPADRCDIDRPLVTMLETLRNEVDDLQEASDLVAATFRPLLSREDPSTGLIEAVHLHIVSEEASSVAELASFAGMNERTFARFCRRHFGFPPGVLLRRQRFLRSLGKYMLDPSLSWINSLDPNYWDQAQFIRDFRSIMQMTPSEYAGLPHPIVTAAVSVTNAGVGVAMQALFHPDRARESETGL